MDRPPRVLRTNIGCSSPQRDAPIARVRLSRRTSVLSPTVAYSPLARIAVPLSALADAPNSARPLSSSRATTEAASTRRPPATAVSAESATVPVVRPRICRTSTVPRTPRARCARASRSCPSSVPRTSSESSQPRTTSLVKAEPSSESGRARVALSASVGIERPMYRRSPPSESTVIVRTRESFAAERVRPSAPCAFNVPACPASRKRVHVYDTRVELRARNAAREPHAVHLRSAELHASGPTKVAIESPVIST